MTAPTTEIEERLAALERSGPPQIGVYDGRGWPPAPLLAPDTPAAQMAEAHQRALDERRAIAQAAEDAAAAERERLAAQAAEAEAIRAQLFAANAPARAKAEAELKVALDRRAVLGRKVTELDGEIDKHRQVIARFAPS